MERPLTSLVERRLAQVITDRMAEAPVVALQGARSVGKSTLLAGTALRNDVEIIDLDDPNSHQARWPDRPGAQYRQPRSTTEHGSVHR